MIFIYIAILAALFIYSYALVDPNITIISAPFWEPFRNAMVQLGYHNRPTSWIIYVLLVLALFGIHSYIVKQKLKIHPVKLALIISGVLLLSYPFLSHDLFNYMFDARILTVHGENPYLHKALDFPQDDWLRFLHWTHRTYPYGPSFLPITLVPSFLALGKFSLNFILFKSLFASVYIAGTYLLSKINKKSALIFATHPLIIVEGLMNNHNDLIALSLAFAGIYYLQKEKNILGRFFLLLSGGIKYLTLPLLVIQKPKAKVQTLSYLGFTLLFGLIWTATTRNGPFPWYFINVFILLPYFPNFFKKTHIFFIGLLLSYYPYIFLGGFDTDERVYMRNVIVASFFAINVLYFMYDHWKSTKNVA